MTLSSSQPEFLNSHYSAVHATQALFSASVYVSVYSDLDFLYVYSFFLFVYLIIGIFLASIKTFLTTLESKHFLSKVLNVGPKRKTSGSKVLLIDISHSRVELSLYVSM